MRAAFSALFILLFFVCIQSPPVRADEQNTIRNTATEVTIRARYAPALSDYAGKKRTVEITAFRNGQKVALWVPKRFAGYLKDNGIGVLSRKEILVLKGGVWQILSRSYLPDEGDVFASEDVIAYGYGATLTLVGNHNRQERQPKEMIPIQQVPGTGVFVGFEGVGGKAGARTRKINHKMQTATIGQRICRRTDGMCDPDKTASLQ